MDVATDLGLIFAFAIGSITAMGLDWRTRGGSFSGKKVSRTLEISEAKTPSSLISPLRLKLELVGRSCTGTGALAGTTRGAGVSDWEEPGTFFLVSAIGFVTSSVPDVFQREYEIEQVGVNRLHVILQTLDELCLEHVPNESTSR
jgi:hypothetical protein